MIIEFKSSINNVIHKKYSRYKELNARYFMQNLSEDEKIELDDLDIWIKLHKDLL
jgi:hypothetical protein